jgi:hypothetical protein
VACARHDGRDARRAAVESDATPRASCNLSVVSTDSLDPYIDAAAQALGIPIDEAWKPEIRANLAVTFKLAAFVGEKELPDDAEPAPVFKA